MHLSQAQGYFYERKKNKKEVSLNEKLDLLKSFEGKSSRETEKALCDLKLEAQILPKERHRILTPTQTEVKFVMTEALKKSIRACSFSFGA